MPFITSLGNSGMIWIALALILMLIPKTRKTGFVVAVSLILEVICCNLILKPFVGRIRPCDVNPAIQLLIPRPTDYSFPSGHAGASFAATAALFGQKSRLWIPSLILSLLMDSQDFIFTFIIHRTFWSEHFWERCWDCLQVRWCITLSEKNRIPDDCRFKSDSKRDSEYEKRSYL